MVVMVVLVAFSATFSASETAYSSLNQIRLKGMASDGVKRADLALENYAHFDKILTVILVGNNIVNTASSTICTMLFTEYFGSEWGVIGATVFMITILLIFGEVTPKTLAKRNPENFAIRVAALIHFATVILSPVVWAFLALTRALSRNMDDDKPVMTEDELYVMIDEIQEDGELEVRESELIKSAIEFDDICVSEIFTPRVDLTATDIRTDVEDMKRIFLDTEYSRIPVYDGTIDRIVGAVHSKDFFFRYVRGNDFEVVDIIRPVKFVPVSASIANILNEMQNGKIQMAVVLDEYGGTLGIVTMEDLLEELVGEIWDENDEVTHEIIKDGDSFIVSGDAPIDEVSEAMGLEFEPEGDFDGGTVSAFIHFKMEKIPRKGDSFDTDLFTVTVKTTKSRRIKEALFTLKAQPGPGVEGGALRTE